MFNFFENPDLFDHKLDEKHQILFSNRPEVVESGETTLRTSNFANGLSG